MSCMSISRKEVLDLWYDTSGRISLETIPLVSSAICKRLNLSEKDEFYENVRGKISKVCYKIRDKWLAAGSRAEFFEKKHHQWLQCEETFSTTGKRGTIGRPEKTFSEVCLRSKRRKVESLRCTVSSSEELAYAAEMKAREEGKETAAKLIHEVMQTTPTRPSKIREILEKQKQTKEVVSLSSDEALSYCIEADLSKSAYLLTRHVSKKGNAAKLFPSYQKLKEAKARCIPANVTITEKCAEVPLQSSLDHCAERLVEKQKEVILTLNTTGEIELEMDSKWGFDGTTDQKRYKQKFCGEQIADDSIIITSTVPLQLFKKEDPEKIIWYNNKASSTRLCRPLKLEFAKETKEFSTVEFGKMDEQIKNLAPTVIQVTSSLTVKITHRLRCTMVDGKVCSAITGLSCQRCCVCGGYPSEFNKLDVILKRPVNKASFVFGLSPLHAYIRLMECLLHIAYRVPFKSGQANTPRKKEMMKLRKTEITDKFRSEMGLLIDLPKSGSGNTNDGNTARRFFEDPAKTASILNISEPLVTHFSVIVQTLNSGFYIDPERFRKYCMDTVHLYLADYDWYPMPPSVHRILIHASDIIAESNLPIGSWSEEAQEARNKDIKKFRENRARKYSRLATNTDVFRRLCISSDPIISSFRRPPINKRSRPLPDAVRDMLVAGGPKAVNPNNYWDSSTDDDVSDGDDFMI